MNTKNTKPILGYVKCVDGHADEIIVDMVYPYTHKNEDWTIILKGDKEEHWFSFRFIEVPPPVNFLFEY